MVVEFDPSSAHLKGLSDDLRNYKVLGIIDRVMLVLDMASYQTYAIKVRKKLYVLVFARNMCIQCNWWTKH